MSRDEAAADCRHRHERLTDRIEAAQLRFVVSENKKHLKPGTSYASFLCVTSHGLLEAIE
jgi:hypothetical protein